MLSMSAERSLKTDLASKESLPQYIQALKDTGYVVVGAEQVWRLASLLHPLSVSDFGQHPAPRLQESVSRSHV